MDSGIRPLTPPVGASSAPSAGNPGSLKTGGLSGGAIKIIAIAAMLIDHTAYAFVDDYYSPLGLVLHFIGRITGPVMFYFVAEGYYYTRNKNRYTLRMAIFAAVSYVPFIYFMHGTLPNSQNFLSLNVIYTLLLGLLALRIRHEIKSISLKTILILLIFFASTFGDWSYLAVLCILLFDFFRGNFRYQAAAYSAVVLTQVLPNLMNGIRSLIFYSLPPETLYYQFAPAILYCGMFLPLLLLYFYNGKRGKGGKWLFYIFYPAHLLLIGFLHAFLTQ